MSADSPMRDAAVWLSTPGTALLEIAADAGFTRAVLDLEHGRFDQGELDLLIPFARALGFEVYAKVIGPQAVWIQQALDFGAEGVIIPHILDVAHAREVCAAAKFPPLGVRSFAGGRIVRYGPLAEGFTQRENRRVRCLPMIESAEALADVAQILALPTVDGVFLGPTDLALSRGRSVYAFGVDDRADLERVARAAREAGKPWIMPAWSEAERRWARETGAGWCVVLDEQGALASGVAAIKASIQAEYAVQR